jgi:sec-independent protein translocase protein TatA
MNLGLPELLVIFVIVVLIFGANRLAGIGRGLGQAIRGFKDEVSDQDEDESERERPRSNARRS